MRHLRKDHPYIESANRITIDYFYSPIMRKIILVQGTRIKVNTFENDINA